MNFCQLITKKRNGGTFTKAEIDFIIDGYTKGEIPDYQMAALLMAIYFKGMTKTETGELTMAMANSGETLDLGEISGVKADKHSTGGVGDKTSLIVLPVAAACGVKSAKMSGKGLGHTGGTIDKLESIPGFRTDIYGKEFIDCVNDVGFAIVGQSKELAPADKLIYALRDVTATVDCLPLIASSIMSKKLASGADVIALDVKVGSGAFMKDLESALELAKQTVDIANHAGKKAAALITNMDIPLGNMVGNSLEVIEAVKTLRGEGPDDLAEICANLAADMISLAGYDSYENALARAKKIIKEGKAYEKFKQFVSRQGGDTSYIDDLSRLRVSPCRYELISEEDGYIASMDTEKIGLCSSELGAGRKVKDACVNHGAGINIYKKTGDFVKKGEKLCAMYTQEQETLESARNIYLSAIKYSNTRPEAEKLIYAKVEKNKVIMF